MGVRGGKRCFRYGGFIVWIMRIQHFHRAGCGLAGVFPFFRLKRARNTIPFNAKHRELDYRVPL